MFILGAGSDYASGSFEIMFTDGTSFPLVDCVMIMAIDDIILEGDHDFSVEIGGVSPPGAVTATESFTVTITDNDGMISSVKA